MITVLSCPHHVQYYIIYYNNRQIVSNIQVHSATSYFWYRILLL